MIFGDRSTYFTDAFAQGWPTLKERPAVAPKGLLQWGRRFLPHHFQASTPSQMHRDMAKLLDSGRRDLREVFIAGRGSAKSTFLTLTDVLRKALEGTEPYIIIASKAADLASEHLRTIREELEGNEGLSAYYGTLCNKTATWNNSELRLNNGVRIRAMGTGSQMRGRKRGAQRPTYVVIDDPQTEESMWSEDQRAKDILWVERAVTPALARGGNVFILGTPLHPDSVVWTFRTRSGWNGHVYPSIQRYPTRMDLWGEWANILKNHEQDDPPAAARAYYEANQEEMDAGALLLWPEWKPLYELMTARETLGHDAFNSEEQCQPSDPRMVEFPSSYFDLAPRFDRWDDGIGFRTAYLDPAMGRRAGKGDYHGLVLLGERANGVMDVEAFILRMPAVQIADFVADQVKWFKPEVFGVEAVTFAELLAPMLEESLTKAAVLCDVVPDRTNVSGENRIRRLSHPLSMRLFRFRRTPGTEELITQLRQFPSGKHDDGPVALEGAWRLLLKAK